MFLRGFIFIAALSTATLFFLSLYTLPVAAQQAATKSSSGKQYTIRYKLRAGETLVSKVEHFAETRTTMADHEEESRSRTTTEKTWEVKSVNPKGEMTFVYRIIAVNMAQSVGEGEELKYDSRSDADIPREFREIASTIEKPLATITINPMGQVINRDKELKPQQLGMGELTIPLPPTPVAIGGEWNVPRKLRVKLDSGVYKTIKVRENYTLEKVSAGVATIRIETQPLTPISDPAIDAQLYQQLSEGQIKFDLDRGRMISKRLDWSDEIVGFRGPDTSLRFNAKYIEQLLPQPKRSASRKQPSTK